jgi:Fic/DOC family
VTLAGCAGSIIGSGRLRPEAGTYQSPERVLPPPASLRSLMLQLSTFNCCNVALWVRRGQVSLMNVALTPPHGELVFSSDVERSKLSRLGATGRATKLSSGVYAVGATLPPEQVARHHLLAIVERYWPGGVVCGRSAIAGGIPVDGALYVAHPNPARTADLRLPGVMIKFVAGPAMLPGDTPFPHGLAMSGVARVLLENVDLQGRPAKFRAGTKTVDDRIDELARSGGAGRIRAVLEQVDVISSYFDPSAVEIVRIRLKALLGSFTLPVMAIEGRLGARLAGAPFDAHRIDMLTSLVDFLLTRAPRPVPAISPASHWEWLAFFEAYFSNFIEGTEFGVDEARRIAVEGLIPTARPADAHDVLATYRLAVDPADRSLVPRSGDELVEILQHRHRVLMAVREDKHPGELKTIRNYGGGYQFVEPQLVAGTLKHGFDVLSGLADPFARSVAMMVLVTECHPFDDGNGRVARLTSNAELSTAGEVRVLIPTVYRNSYLAALSGFSNGAGRGESLISVLDYAQRWAAAVDWTDYASADATMTRCNAYLDSATAERSAQHLMFPRSV